MKAVEDVILREIAGEYILVPVGAAAGRLNGMVSLNGSGRLLWQRLQAGCTEADLAEALLAEYEVDRPVAEADVRAFLAKVRQAGMLAE